MADITTIDTESVATEIARMHREADTAEGDPGEGGPIAWRTGLSDVDQDVRYVRPDWVAGSDTEREAALSEIESRVVDLYDGEA
jgi:hypothetical protein